MVTLFCVCGTIAFLMLGVIWSKEHILNVLIKCSLFLMFLCGLVATLEQMGFHR